jgi:acylphosphatase
MRAHVYISGFVQGVGFRHFVKKNAQKLELSGYVKNLRSGQVEAVFEGEKKKISRMIDLCRKGPFLSSVSELRILEEDETGEFEIFEVSR